MAICRGGRPPQSVHNNNRNRNNKDETASTQSCEAIQSYGLRLMRPSRAVVRPVWRPCWNCDRPHLSLIVWTTPTPSSSKNSSLMNDVCRHSLACQSYLARTVDRTSQGKILPLSTDGHELADLVRHPVGHHVLGGQVCTDHADVTDGLLQLLLSSSSQRADQGHPILRRLFNERLQLPLRQEKGAKAWR
jgi:hypothetical protein